MPRSTGVCADVVIRAARDGLGLDLQKLVHEDMVKDFRAYHQMSKWGMTRPDANIDHRRVLNLETYWTRAGARLWAASAPTPGDGFPKPVEVGDILTWLLDARLPHVGIVVSVGSQRQVVHNIGRGVELIAAGRVPCRARGRALSLAGGVIRRGSAYRCSRSMGLVKSVTRMCAASDGCWRWRAKNISQATRR